MAWPASCHNYHYMHVIRSQPVEKCVMKAPENAHQGGILTCASKGL